MNKESKVCFAFTYIVKNCKNIFYLNTRISSHKKVISSIRKIRILSDHCNVCAFNLIS